MKKKTKVLFGTRLYQGDCRKVLRGMEKSIFDSCVTDPPYGLSFMGKGWDHGVPGVEFWQEILRVLKPGAHLLAFGGTRTFHRLMVNIEDAGFEIRDTLMWVYGSGFPKSQNVSKVIDKQAGVEFEKYPASGVGFMNAEGRGGYNVTKNQLVQVGESTEEAKQWEGWGTALKPAWEPIIMARKPLSEKTIAKNVLKWGTGAINIDGCRIHSEDVSGPRKRHGGGIKGNASSYELPDSKNDIPPGRFPANLIHDGSDEVEQGFPITGSPRKARKGKRGGSSWHGRESFGTPEKEGVWPEDTGGSASRFFYCSKASKKDRADYNNHPTVKPTDLMRYLCRLVTQPGGHVLDPFMGSGSTGKGAVLEGFRFTGIDLEDEYVEIARKRIKAGQ